ncbi:acyl carrier protein [Solihabitans fulvus]|uniref:Acyl carrier protein n=1 Tax=Solihabitans fulvus TaxID=1892852 RepID=A0A5B2X210_9PSEU|nr:phosphopantetheine-binding protein [Solihabitans fulvus]KAA2257264.1 acyl carrier protein [Solihabitans fulvus]
MTRTEFTALLDSELGLDYGPDDLDRPFDQLGDWDSVNLLHLVTVLERQGARKFDVVELLSAKSLADVHALAY